MTPTTPTFKKVYNNDQDFQQLQSNIEAAFLHIISKEIFGGSLKKDIAITTADTFIDHPLDREPNGWIIVRKNANADIWESSTINTFKERIIILKSDATVTASIWFF